MVARGDTFSILQYGMAALNHASEKGHLDVVRALLQEPADVDIQDVVNNCTLHTLHHNGMLFM